MDHFFEFLQNYQKEFFAFPIIWLVLVISVSIIYRKRKAVSQIPFDETNLRFYENAVSGSSHKNILTRLGGARNCLKVSVNDKEVYIRPFFPFNLMFLPEIYDLEHRISKEQIVSLERRKGLIVRDSVLLTYSDSTGNQKIVELYIKHAEQFISNFPRFSTNAG